MGIPFEEITLVVAQLQHDLRDSYKVVNLTRPLEEIEAELADDYERRFVRREKEHGARMALIAKRAS